MRIAFFTLGIVAILTMSLGFSARAKNPGKKNEGLKAITSSEIFKDLYIDLLKTKEISGSEIGTTGYFVEVKSKHNNLSEAQMFHSICSPTSPYRPNFFGEVPYNTVLSSYVDLSSEKKAKVRSFIIGAATDDFYCGSILQLSFPLETAFEELKHMSEELCLNRVDLIPRHERYDKLFFELNYRSPERLEENKTIKDMIKQTLLSGELCQ